MRSQGGGPSTRTGAPHRSCSKSSQASSLQLVMEPPNSSRRRPTRAAAWHLPAHSGPVGSASRRHSCRAGVGGGWFGVSGVTQGCKGWALSQERMHQGQTKHSTVCLKPWRTAGSRHQHCPSVLTTHHGGQVQAVYVTQVPAAAQQVTTATAAHHPQPVAVDKGGVAAAGGGRRAVGGRAAAEGETGGWGEQRWVRQVGQEASKQAHCSQVGTSPHTLSSPLQGRGHEAQAVPPPLPRGQVQHSQRVAGACGRDAAKHVQLSQRKAGGKEGERWGNKGCSSSGTCEGWQPVHSQPCTALHPAACNHNQPSNWLPVNSPPSQPPAIWPASRAHPPWFHPPRQPRCGSPERQAAHR